MLSIPGRRDLAPAALQGGCPRHIPWRGVDQNHYFITLEMAGLYVFREGGVMLGLDADVRISEIYQ